MKTIYRIREYEKDQFTIEINYWFFPFIWFDQHIYFDDGEEALNWIDAILSNKFVVKPKLLNE